MSACNQFNVVDITGVSLLVLLIAAGMFYMGMLPFAQYFTGQKAITIMGSAGSIISINRDGRCVIFYLAYSLMFLLIGALVILTF